MVGRSREIQIKGKKARWQKREEKDVGGNGEGKEVEDRDRQDEKTTFSAWHSVNIADKWVMMKMGAVWNAAFGSAFR